MNGCWILSNAFSSSIEMIMWSLTFLLLMWSMTLIVKQALLGNLDSCMKNQ